MKSVEGRLKPMIRDGSSVSQYARLETSSREMLLSRVIQLHNVPYLSSWGRRLSLTPFNHLPRNNSKKAEAWESYHSNDSEKIKGINSVKTAEAVLTPP